jgi:urease accessory protein
MRLVSPVSLLLALVTLATPALAHTGPGGGVAAGFAHPFGGLDHVLAMIAVGLWAAQLGGRALWQVPAGFLVAMLAGGALGASDLARMPAEAGILASVLLLGLLVAFAVRLPQAIGLVLVAAFALCHGHAHGSEMPAGAPLAFALGFGAATAALHAIGIAAGVVLRDGRALRWGGAGIAAAGLVLMIGAWVA